MAPLPTIENVYRVALNWQYGSQSACNVMNFRASNSEAGAGYVYFRLNAAVTNTMWGSVPTSARVTSVDITPLDGVTATATFSPTDASTNWEGATDGQAVPAVAVLAKLSTHLRGQAHRGRVFIPFTSESVIDSGFIIGLTRTSIEAAWETFLTTILVPDDEGDFVELTVASYLHSTAEPVSSITIESPLATQRRRQNRNR